MPDMSARMGAVSGLTILHGPAHAGPPPNVPPATNAGVEAMRARIVRARHTVLDAAADSKLDVPTCQACKAALDRADMLADIADAAVTRGDAGDAAWRLGDAVEIVAAIPPALAAAARRRHAAAEPDEYADRC